VSCVYHYLYSGISNGQVVQAIALFRIVIAIEVLQQQYSFPNVCRVFTPHEAPGIFKLSFLRNVRRVQLLIVYSFEFLKKTQSRQTCHKMMQHSRVLRIAFPNQVDIASSQLRHDSRVESVKLIMIHSRNCGAQPACLWSNFFCGGNMTYVHYALASDAIIKDSRKCRRKVGTKRVASIRVDEPHESTKKITSRDYT
jgi:hypothetical protein